MPSASAAAVVAVVNSAHDDSGGGSMGLRRVPYQVVVPTPPNPTSVASVSGTRESSGRGVGLRRFCAP